MSPHQLSLEQDRFNSLTQEEATKILKAANGHKPHLRTCWYCNTLHEHLKKLEMFTCFACGLSYMQGYPSPVVVKRSKGEQLAISDMNTFNSILEERS